MHEVSSSQLVFANQVVGTPTDLAAAVCEPFVSRPIAKSRWRFLRAILTKLENSKYPTIQTIVSVQLRKYSTHAAGLITRS
jgi:hypothetical protein